MPDLQYTTLQLVGEHETINFLDGINYGLVEWAPAVASRDRSLLGNYSPYRNVEEVFVLNVWGESTYDALDHLDALNRVLEQAESWYMGENSNPVLIQCQILGSILDAPLEAIVLGRPSNADEFMRLQPTFNQDLALYEISNVEVRLLRRGLWLGETLTQSTPTELSNPGIRTVDMGERLDRLSPTTVRITGFDAGTEIIGSGFLIVTGVRPTSTYGRNIGLYGVASLTSDEFTTVDDSANLAHLDDVARIDAAGFTSGKLTLAGLYAEVSRISIFAAVRNNSTETAWRVRCSSYGYATVTDRWQTIAAGSQQPRIIYVGSLANQTNQHVNIDLEFETDGEAGTLDVNYILVVGHDESTNYIAISGIGYSTAAFVRSLVVADRSATHRTPLLYIETSS